MSDAEAVVSYAVTNSGSGDLITITIQFPQPWVVPEPLKIAESFAHLVTGQLQIISTGPVLIKPSA